MWIHVTCSQRQESCSVMWSQVGSRLFKHMWGINLRWVSFLGQSNSTVRFHWNSHWGVGPRQWSPSTHQDGCTGCLWWASVPAGKNLNHTGFIHSFNKHWLSSYQLPGEGRFAMKLIKQRTFGASHERRSLPRIHIVMGVYKVYQVKCFPHNWLGPLSPL